MSRKVMKHFWWSLVISFLWFLVTFLPEIIKSDHQRSKRFHLTWWLLVINQDQSWLPIFIWERQAISLQPLKRDMINGMDIVDLKELQPLHGSKGAALIKEFPLLSEDLGILVCWSGNPFLLPVPQQVQWYMFTGPYEPCFLCTY